MSGNNAAACSVILEGEWYLDKAADLLALLAGKLAQLLGANPRPARVEIDLTGISDLDACGCQLLVVFLEDLRRHGIAPVPGRIPQQIMAKIELLGFSEAFTASEQESV